jgi:Metal-dependent hydrolases of the beta-lactamase superfamily I
MKILNLASSSSGNCYIVEIDTSKGAVVLMLECGLPYGEILSKLNSERMQLSEIDFCFVSHCHNDHSQSLKAISNAGIKTFASSDSKKRHGGRSINLKHLQSVELVPGNILLVTPIEVMHDEDTETFAFIIESDKESLLFITDCLKFTNDLSQFKFDFIMVECNYYQPQLFARIKQLQDRGKAKEASQLIRVSKTHMSHRGTINVLKRLDLSRCSGILLIHLSDNNANEFRMKSEIVQAIQKPVYIALKNGGIH